MPLDAESLVALSQLYPDGRLPAINSSAWLAAAQHYGIPTDYLDFTLDPAMAVFFACQRSKKRGLHRLRAVDGLRRREAVVFMLDVHAARTAGLELVLPPPFVTRLHLQSGVLMKKPPPSLRGLCREVRFPRSAGFRVPGHKGPLDPLPEDRWLTGAVAWAQRSAVKQVEPYGRTIFPLLPFFRGVLLKDWITLMETMVSRLAVRKTADGEYFFEELHWIAAANPGVARLLARSHDLDAARERAAGYWPLAHSHKRLAMELRKGARGRTRDRGARA